MADDDADNPVVPPRRSAAPISLSRLSTLNKRKASPAPSLSGSGSASNRTLLDIIVDDDDDTIGGGNGWRGVKDHMRLHRAGAAFGRPNLGRCTSSIRHPGDTPTDVREEKEDDGPLTLMALLEQADKERVYNDEEEDERGGEAEEDDEDEEEGRGDNNGGEMYVCCVCMVRHKGAAFIPCGHTFCRMCSRELWVTRGNCPLCNGFILEILDIF